MAKKVIKLNESELHDLICECVKKVLSEGQGWNNFRSHVDAMNNDKIINVEKTPEERRHERENFIKTGDFDGENKEFYNSNGYATNDSYEKYSDGNYRSRYDMYQPNKRIEKGLGGRIGRAASLAASDAYDKGHELYNRGKDAYNRWKNNEK